MLGSILGPNLGHGGWRRKRRLSLLKILEITKAERPCRKLCRLKQYLYLRSDNS